MAVLFDLSACKGVRLAGCLLALATLSNGAPAIAADDATTYGEAFDVPVFERVDKNGVDLVTGMLRLASPTFSYGTEEARTTVGMQWVGRGWLLMDTPTISRKGSTYYVSYMGATEEFRDRDNNYAQKKPISGSTLSCSIFEPGNLAAECLYTNRNGDVVHFKGMRSNITPYPGNYGVATSRLGNIGMDEARLVSIDNRYRVWGNHIINGFSDPNYWKQTYILGGVLTIYTPNHGSGQFPQGDEDENHYLRPKGTTQTITDPAGATWRYTVNSDREMTVIDPPGGGANISFSYNNDHKVTSVTNADGTWTYSYSSSGDYGTTTATNPLGEQTYVKYHKDRGYVTEVRDANNRTTYYQYDSGYRLERITYPEGNYIAFTYDSRGNPTSRTIGPKPGQSGSISESAGYPATCADPVLCNRPLWIQDANGKRTDFQYPPTSTDGGSLWRNTNALQWIPVTVGTGKPSVVQSPPAAAGGIRPEVRNVYQNGVLIQSSYCRTLQTCAGTADEVITTYDYGSTATNNGSRMQFGKAETAEGQTLRTCYGYDGRGNRISETPPSAGLSSCPQDVFPGVPTLPVTGQPAAAPTYP